MYELIEGTGNTVIKAMAVLKEHNVLEENIILSNLFCTPVAAKSLVTAFPQVMFLNKFIFLSVKSMIHPLSRCS